MRIKFFQTFFILVTLCATLHAEDVIHMKKTSSFIEVDGYIDEVWELLEYDTINKDINGDKPSSDDCSGLFRVLYDDVNLYLIIEMKDDFLSDDGDTYDSEAINHQDDGFDIVFDTDNGKEKTIDPEDDFLLSVNYSETGICGVNGTKDNFGVLPITNIKANCSTISGGWIFEMSIPLSDLSLSSDEFGFGIRYNDDDQTSSPGLRESNITWELEESWTGWKLPADWGTVILTSEYIDVFPTSMMKSYSESFKLSPNPASSMITLNNIAPGSKVNIYNNVGVLLISQRAKSHKIQLNISHLQGGTYIVQVGSSSQKILVR